MGLQGGTRWWQGFRASAARIFAGDVCDLPLTRWACLFSADSHSSASGLSVKSFGHHECSFSASHETLAGQMCVVALADPRRGPATEWIWFVASFYSRAASTRLLQRLPKM